MSNEKDELGLIRKNNNEKCYEDGKYCHYCHSYFAYYSFHISFSKKHKMNVKVREQKIADKIEFNKKMDM